MKIRSVTLDNFRCFKHAEIDFSADVIAIHGRNGTGKTTIFDGIEFALLGSIGRFSDRPDPPDYLTHVFADNQASVKVDFDEGRSWVRVAANHCNNTMVFESSGEWRNHNQLLYKFLMDEDYAPPRQEIKPAADMFRSTIFLSQELMWRFIDASGDERSKVLSWIAGAAYYQKCLDKAADVVEEARRREIDEKNQFVILRNIVGQLKAKIEEQNARIAEVKEQMGDKLLAYSDLTKALRRAGLPVSHTAPLSADMARELAASARGICMERLSLLDEQSKRLAELEAILPQHLERVQRKQDLHKMLNAAQKELVSLLDQENSSAASLKQTERAITDTNIKLADLTKRFRSFQRLPELQQRLTELTKTRDAAKTRLNELQKCHNQVKVELQALKVNIDDLKSQITKLRAEKESTSARLTELDNLSGSLARYESAKKQSVEADREFGDAVTRRRKLEALLKDLQQKQSELSATLADVNADLARIRGSSDETAKLISRLREHVTDNICPLCGHKHSSPEALQKAIQIRLKDVPRELQIAMKKFETTSNELVGAREELSSKQREIARLEENSTDAQIKREKAQTEMREIQAAAAVLDVPLMKEFIDASINRNHRLLEEQNVKLRQKEEKAQKTAEQIEEATLKVASLTNALAYQNNTYGDIQSQLNKLELDVIDLGLSDSIELSPDEVMRAIKDNHSKLTELEKAKSRYEAQKVKLQNNWELSRAERVTVERNIQEWQQTIKRLSTEIEEFMSLCKKLGLQLDTSRNALAAKRDSLDEQRAKLQEATSIVRQYELSCRVTELEKERDALASQYNSECAKVKKLQQNIAILKTAQGEANTWTEILKCRVDDVVEKTIVAHQPQIERLFKGMIPHPYFFEKISMERGSKGLELGLRYRGQQDNAGEPLFFLSGAQANVLALAIFMSLASDARWSKLDTLLLDDPVQNLDDLDAVAFLDWLRAVARGKTCDRKKQIIVSTCDQNLYLLMLHKFNSLQAEGLRFTGISLLDKGLEGPEIHYDIGGPEYLSSAAKTG